MAGLGVPERVEVDRLAAALAHQRRGELAEAALGDGRMPG